MNFFKKKSSKVEEKKNIFGYEISAPEHLLFLTIGIAMVKIQNFEATVAAILFSLEASGEDLTLDKIDEAMDRFDSQTLGRLIHKMKQKVGGEHLHEKLTKARDGRNFIVHHSLRTYSDLDEKASVILSKKIENIQTDIDETQKLLISELSAQDVTHISKIYIDPETLEIKQVEE